MKIFHISNPIKDYSFLRGCNLPTSKIGCNSILDLSQNSDYPRGQPFCIETVHILKNSEGVVVGFILKDSDDNGVKVSQTELEFIINIFDTTEGHSHERMTEIKSWYFGDDHEANRSEYFYNMTK